MSRVDQFRARLVFGHVVIQIAAGDLPHLVFRAHDDGELLGLVFFAPGPIPDEDREETGKPIGVVRAGGFQVAAERLGAHIDAKDRLGMGPHRRMVLGGDRLGFDRRTQQHAEEVILISGLEGLEPHRTMRGFRKGVDPIQQGAKGRQRTVHQQGRNDLERLGQREQASRHEPLRSPFAARSEFDLIVMGEWLPFRGEGVPC